MKFQARILSFLASLVALTVVGADDDLTSLSYANNQFSRLLFAQLAPSYDNLVISPYSLHSALSMTSVGTRGETLKEMKAVLQTSDFADDTDHKIYKELIQSFDNTGPVDVLTANGIFQNPKLTINETFQSQIQSWYSVVAQELDFQSSEGPEHKVNNWVEAETKGMIKDLFAANTIEESETDVILVNTLYFKGNWSTPFDPLLGSTEFFFINLTDSVQVDMMKAQGEFNIKVENEYSVLKLPFTRERFALYLVIPNNSSELESVNDCLPYRYPDYMYRYNISGLAKVPATIKMPKFEINFRQSMVDILRRMGMKLAFTSLADFSGISDDSEIIISDIVQQAVIKVTESGTTASAATFVNTNRMLIADERNFTVNKPFWFFLRDDLYEEVLFQGKFTRPQDNPNEFARKTNSDIPTCGDDGPDGTPDGTPDSASVPSNSLIGFFLCVLFSLCHLL